MLGQYLKMKSFLLYCVCFFLVFLCCNVTAVVPQGQQENSWQFCGWYGGGCYPAVVPDPNTSELQIAKEYVQAMNERGLASGLNSLEGYIAAELLIDAIKHINLPYTKEKIIGYFEKMKNYKFKGLTLTFNTQKRDLSQPVWLRTIDYKWIEYKTK